MLGKITNFLNKMMIPSNISDKLSTSTESINENLQDIEAITTDAAVNAATNIIKVPHDLDLTSILDKLDENDIVGILFLGFNNPESALKILEDGFRKDLSDSILQWTKQDTKWQKKIIEALCTIQNFKVLHELGYDKQVLIDHYLPHNIFVANDISKTRKSLYFLSENLDKNETNTLIEHVKKDLAKQNMGFKHFSHGYLELYLLHWEMIGYNLTNILNHLKVMELYVLKDKLSMVIKSEPISNVERERNFDKPLSKKTVYKKSKRSERTVDNDQHCSFTSESTGLFSIGQDNYNAEEVIQQNRYYIDVNNPGICLIINQHFFYRDIEERFRHLLAPKKFEHREGTEPDKNNLEKTFKSFGFKVIIKDDLTHFQILDAIKKVVKDITNESSLFVCILSHGDKDVVYGVNSCQVPVKQIQNIICKKNKQNLAKKPKVLILQSCQGHETQKISMNEEESDCELTMDGGIGAVPDTVDMLNFWATVPGYAAIRDKKQGTWFIQSLCNKMQTLGNHMHFLDICTTIVDDVTSKKWGDAVMTPYIESTFRKTLYLPSKR